MGIGLLPLLIPGVLLQLSIQVFFILRSLNDRRLTLAKRRLYSVMIAVFGLPAAAVYLFKNVERSLDEGENSAPNLRRGIFLLLVMAYEVMGLHMLAENVSNPSYIPLAMLLCVSFLVMLLYNLMPEGNRLAAGQLFPVLQMLLSIPMLYLDRSGDNLFLSLIAGISAINQAPLPRAKVYGIGALGAYLVGSTAKTVFFSGFVEVSELVRYFFVNTLVVLLALVAFYTLKKQMVTSGQLERALGKLKEQSERLKGLAVIEERNRIAAEMHDTVGHTLTAAVLTLEATEALVTEQPQVAVQKLRQGNELVRRGLSELRASVRAVKAETPLDFVAALERLLEEIRSDTGLAVHSVLDAQVHPLPLHAGILLSAVKECATNAIRHGHASHADILIGEHKGQLRLAFTDNGVGTANARSGSGLNIMRERVQGVGGTLQTESAPGEGFTVSLTIPVAQGREDTP